MLRFEPLLKQNTRINSRSFRSSNGIPIEDTRPSGKKEKNVVRVSQVLSHRNIVIQALSLAVKNGVSHCGLTSEKIGSGNKI